MVTKITDYSTTAGSNTDVAGISLAEGWAPSTVNNLLRALIAQMAGAAQSEGGWLELQTGITAGTTQTIAGAYALTSPLSHVTTCANASDGVALPANVAETQITIVNGGAYDLKIWPNNGASDTINGGSADAADANLLAAGDSRTYMAINGTNWVSQGVSAAGFVSGDVILADDGTYGAPGLSFADDTDCGLYRVGTNSVGLTVGGSDDVFIIDSTERVLIGNVASASGAAGSINAMNSSVGSNGSLFENSGNGNHNFTSKMTHSDGSGGACFQALMTGETQTGIYLHNSNAAYDYHFINPYASATASSTAFNFFKAQATTDIEFYLKGDGNATCDGSWTGGGADYAEYFEWSDGNVDSEDRVGTSVVLEGNLIRAATDDDAAATIIGVVSANPVVVGDAAWNKWHGKHLRDDFGRYVWEEVPVYTWKEALIENDPDNFSLSNEKDHSYAFDKIPEGVTVPDNVEPVMVQRRKVNPDWVENVELDEDGAPIKDLNGETTSKYIPREDRPEWDTIGLMGKLRMKKGQPAGDRWIKMRDVSDDVEEWLVR